MQSRKKQNQEVERKIRNQKRVHAAVFFAIIAVVVLAIAWVIWDTQNRRFIMTFNGERVETNDFRLVAVLADMPINDATRHHILEDLKMYMTIMQMANRYGITISPQEREENEIQARLIREMLEIASPGIMNFTTDRRIGEFVGIFQQLLPGLVDELVVGDFEVDEEEFARELAEHIELLIEQGTETWVKYLAAETREALFYPALALQAGEDDFDFDFDAIALEYCILQTGTEPILLTEFLSIYGIWDIIGIDPRDIPVGHPTQTLEGINHFFIAYIHDRRPPELDYDEIEEEFRENFILFGATEIFWDMLLEEIGRASVQINHRVFDTLIMH